MRRQMIDFQSEIELKSQETPQEIINNVIKMTPELLYYLHDYSYSRSGLIVNFKFTYVNQSFPMELITFSSINNVEWILRNNVMNYNRKIVIILHNNCNYEWKMNQFKILLAAFYPNLRSCSTVVKKFDAIPFVVYEISFVYRIGTVMLKTMEQEISEKVKQINKLLFHSEMPDYVKCYIAHNYLASTVTYCDIDHTSPLEKSYIQSAYGALIKNKCVCQGYAEAYKRLLDSAGIACDVVSGKVLREKENKEEWHAWNIVHLKNGSVHCHVDVTWDSRLGKNLKEYIFKSDDYFDHQREWNRYYYPSCSDESRLLGEAQNYCREHKKELCGFGIITEWM